MSRTPNNEYLRQIADTVDPGGGGSGRQYNNDYLKRIAEGIDAMSGSVDPSTGKVDASKIDGVIPSANLPSYVDDVVEGYMHDGSLYSDSRHAYEIQGETGKIYVDLSTQDTYRWSGSEYVRIGGPLEAATQAEAEAGQVDSKYMTPLRTAQAIAAQVTGLSAADIAEIKAAM